VTNVPYQKNEIDMPATLSDNSPRSKTKYICQLPLWKKNMKQNIFVSYL